MNLRTVLPPVLVAILGLGVLAGIQNTGFREQIEDTLTEHAQEALSAAGLGDVDVKLTGRDAAVTAGSDTEALAAAELVGDVEGVRTAVAYGPDGQVSTAAAEAEAADGDDAGGGDGSGDDTGEADAEASASPEASADDDASPEASEPTSDETGDGEDGNDGTGEDGTGDGASGDETSGSEDSGDSEDDSADEPTREEREEAQEDLVEIPNITFVTDSARLTKDGRRVVEEAAEVLAEHPDVEVRIEGHTDSVGSDAHNQRLSERRAEKVLEELAELGVDRDRLTAKGYGESDPLVVPRTFADLEKNRRVEFDVVD